MHDVLGVFRVIDQPVDGIKKPILIATNQFAKGCRSPLQTLSDEPMIVGVHGSLFWLDADGKRIVPQTGPLVTQLLEDVQLMMPQHRGDVKTVSEPHCHIAKSHCHVGNVTMRP